MAMMHQGKVIAHGTPDEMWKIDNPVLQQFISDENHHQN
jgi:ABC-type transporter Mla maintaining outer membrane lipid asymmetry ATPase subunit MlaF